MHKAEVKKKWRASLLLPITSFGETLMICCSSPVGWSHIITWAGFRRRWGEEQRLSGWITKAPSNLSGTIIENQLRKLMTKYVAPGLARAITGWWLPLATAGRWTKNTHLKLLNQALDCTITQTGTFSCISDYFRNQQIKKNHTHADHNT